MIHGATEGVPMMLESLVRSSPVDLLPGAVQFALEFPEREKDLVTGYCPACFGVEQYVTD